MRRAPRHGFQSTFGWRAVSRRWLAALSSVGLVLGLSLIGGAGVASAAPGDFIDVTKTVDKAEIASGDTFQYTMTVTCSQDECIDAQLEDIFPAELDGFAIGGVTYSPSSLPTTIEWSTDDGTTWTSTRPSDVGTQTRLKVSFQQPLVQIAGEGLVEGQQISVRVPLTAPTDKTPGTYEWDNKAEASATNANTKDDTAHTRLVVPLGLGVAVNKTWTPATADFDPGAAGADSTITIGATNTSNDDVDTLVIQEPQSADDGATSLPASNPFQIVDLKTALGAVTLPNGANQVQVDAYVWDAGTSQYKWELGSAAVSAALPGGVAAGDVAGLRFTFSNSDGTTKIDKSATASVTLPVTQRTHSRDANADLSLAAHSVTNVAEATVTHGADTPAKSTGTASYTMNPPSLSAAATKTFTPAAISKGESATVSLTGRNTSSVPVNELKLSEGAGFFSATDKVLFGGFTSGIAWPSGATSAKVVYHFGTAGDEDVSFADGTTPGNPTTNLSSDYVTGFDIVFSSAGNGIAVDATVTAAFTVTTDETATPTAAPTGRENTLTTTATRANGLDAVKTSKPRLQIVDPSVAVEITKTVLPSTDLHPGENVTVKLDGTMTRSSDYVKGTEIVFEDSLDTQAAGPKFWDAFDLDSLAPTQLPANTSLKVEVRDDAGAWHDATTIAATGSASIVTVDEATIASAVTDKDKRTGIRLTFTNTDSAGFPAHTNIVPYFVATTRAAERGGAAFPQDPESAKTFNNTAKITGEGTTPQSTSLTDTDTDAESAKVRRWPASGPGDGGYVGIDKGWNKSDVISQSGLERDTTLAWKVSPGFGTVTITDDADPATGGYDVAHTVFDAFDLVEINSISANTTPYTNGWFLKYDTVKEVWLFDSTDGGGGTPVGWTLVTPTGTWQDNGAFDGYTLSDTERASTTAVRIVLEPNDPARTAAATSGSDPYAPAVGTGVATSSGNRTFDLTWELRNTKRSTGDFVTGSATYNNWNATTSAYDPGVVKNTATITGSPLAGGADATKSASDLITITDTVPLVAVSKAAKNTTAGTPGNSNPIYVPVHGGEPSGQQATFTITAHNASVSRASYVTVMDPPICADPQNDITACEDATATAASAVMNPFDPARTDGWLTGNPFDRLGITNIAITASKPGEVDLTKSTVWLLSYDGSAYRVDKTTASAVNSAAGSPVAVNVDGGGTVALAAVVGISVTFQGTDPGAVGGTIAQDNNLTITVTATPRATVRSTGEAQTMGADELVTVENRAFAQSYDPVANNTVKTGDAAADTVTLTGGNLNVAATKSFSPTTLLEPNRHDAVTVTLSANHHGSELSPKRVTITDDVTDSPDFWNRFDLTAVTASVTPPKGADRLVISLYDGVGWQDGAAVAVNGDGSASAITLADALPGVTLSSAQGIRYAFYKDDDTYFDANVPSEAWSAQVTFSVTLRDTLRTGGALDFADPPTVIDNTVTAENWRSATEHVDSPATAQITLSKGTYRLQVTKTANGGGTHQVAVGDPIPFRLTVKNDGTGYLDLIEVRDVLPTHLKYTGDAPAYTKDSGGLLSDAVTLTEDNGDLVFTWPVGSNRMKPGETFIIDITLELQPGLSSGQHPEATNRMVAKTEQTLSQCTGEPSGTNTWANDKQTCSDTDYVEPEAGLSMFIAKGVRGTDAAGDPGAVNLNLGGAACAPGMTVTGNDFYRSPCVANSHIGGQNEWALRVVNSGTESVRTMTIYDQFPVAGDKMIVAGDRLSEYRPVPDGPPVVTVPDNATAMTVEVTSDPGVCEGTWAALPAGTPCEQNGETWVEPDGSTDWSTVSGLRIVLDFTPTTAQKFQPADEVTVTYTTTNRPATVADPSRAPVTLHASGDVLAWNQFGIKYHGVETDADFRLASSKVGVRLPVGSLEVTKAVTGNTGAAAGKTFDVAVQCTIEGEPVDLGTSATLQFGDTGGTQQIDGIPLGADCTVSEVGALGAYGEASRSISPVGGMVTIGGTPQTVTVTNTYSYPPGGGGGTPPPSTTPTATTTPTTPVTTTTTVPPTTPTIPTIGPSSATGTTTPPPPTNVPGITTSVPEPNQCVDLVEHGFDPGETVTITVTGPDGQYTITAVADENGDVAFCLQSAVPVRVVIEVLGEHHVVVREVVLGIGDELPNTGVPVLQYLSWALLLLGAGAALLLFGRRGRKGKHFAR